MEPNINDTNNPGPFPMPRPPSPNPFNPGDDDDEWETTMPPRGFGADLTLPIACANHYRLIFNCSKR
jgi:hypothetical protein